MNRSIYTSGFILLLSCLILIWILNKKKTRENFSESNDVWWNFPPKVLGGIAKDRNQINTHLTCGPNQYLEKNTNNFQKLCYHTNKTKGDFLDNDIVYFKEDEFSITRKTSDYNQPYNKIQSRVTQKPSPYLKENYGFRNLTFDNGYIDVEDKEQSSFKSTGDFIRHQTCKKYDVTAAGKQSIPPTNKNVSNQIAKNETLSSFLSTGDVINPKTNKPYMCKNGKDEVKAPCKKGNMGRYKFNIDDPDTKKNNIRRAYHDLFGEAHPDQKDTNYLVSRGYGKITRYTDNPVDSKLDGRFHHSTETDKICKECPVSTIQTYRFSLDNNPNVSDYEKSRRRGDYFVEMGGTFKHTRAGVKQCHLCSYQSGCYAPQAGRTNMFQIQSCSEGRDRKCQRCKTCNKGEEKLLKFCGEGGGSSDTECTNCTPCKPDEYKVAGCDTNNAVEDNRCIKKTVCLGVPKSGDTFKDPGPGRRTYVTFDGYTGSRSGNVKDEYGKIISLKNPYYGKDRVCQICDDCPEGFKLIRGCSGINSKENAVCQKQLNIDNILDRDIRPPEGYFYNTEKVKQFIKIENLKLTRKDEKIRQEYMKKHRRNPLRYPLTKINSPELFKNSKLPKITDQQLLEQGKQKCRVCPPGFFKDPNDPGCIGRTDTKCIPHTRCKTDGTEKIKIPGTPTSDVVCGPCKCPEGLIGSNPKCSGSQYVRNCVKNIPCNQIKPGTNTPSAKKIIGTQGDKNEKIYTFDKPSAYGDSTRSDRCKVCDKKCPAGKFQLGECDPERSTNIVCQDHTKCDPETQIVVEPGTATKDTVCKCIDGYEWDKDEYGVEDRKKPCKEILGKCHTNPCHPEAICYDNFDENNKFIDFTCKCDLDKNYIETGDLGVGPKGCIKISDKHAHQIPDIDVNELSAPQISDYLELIESKPSVVSTLAHTRGLAGTDLDGQFHSSLHTPHLHK